MPLTKIKHFCRKTPHLLTIGKYKINYRNKHDIPKKSGKKIMITIITKLTLIEIEL